MHLEYAPAPRRKGRTGRRQSKNKSVTIDLDRGVTGWIYRTANKNFWRVADWYDFDDLVQDGYLCFFKVISTYVKTGKAQDKEHVMALFQTTYTNYIHRLARKKTKQIDTPALDGILPQAQADEWAAVEQLLAEAPAYIGKAVAALAKAGTRPLRRRLGGTRETTQERLCRIMGCDPADMPNLRDEIRAYLTT